MSRIRLEIRVQGIVQGVGFRPFVFSLARRLGLGGFVSNDSEGVLIEIEGPLADVTGFLPALEKEAPPLASIEKVKHPRLG
jgi:hydrogenase maturation protein HypF